jgi:hypothetical protein
MAVLQRRDPALSADRLKNALTRDAEVRVVNRQICIIMTPLAADELATQLLAPKPAPAAPPAQVAGRADLDRLPARAYDDVNPWPVRGAVEANVVERPRPAPTSLVATNHRPPATPPEADIFEQLPPLSFDRLPSPVVELKVVEIQPPVRPAQVHTSDPTMPSISLPVIGADPAASDIAMPLDPTAWAQPKISAQPVPVAPTSPAKSSAKPTSEEAKPSAEDDGTDHLPSWFRRFELVVRDEVDWYRRRT